MNEFKQYQRVSVAEMRPVTQEEITNSCMSEEVSISKADLDAGSPKEGDMVARNPDNHHDQWLVNKEYFKTNFKSIQG